MTLNNYCNNALNLTLKAIPDISLHVVYHVKIHESLVFSRYLDKSLCVFESSIQRFFLYSDWLDFRWHGMDFKISRKGLSWVMGHYTVLYKYGNFFGGVFTIILVYFSIFWGVFYKRIVPLVLIGFEMIMLLWSEKKYN